APVQEKVFSGYIGKTDEDKEEMSEAAAFQMDAYQMSEIENAYTKNLIAAGMIIIKNPDEQAIAAITNSLMTKVAAFTATINQVKENKPIETKETKETGTCPECGMIYPERGRNICPKCIKKGAIFTRLLAFTKKHKLRI